MNPISSVGDAQFSDEDLRDGEVHVWDGDGGMDENWDGRVDSGLDAYVDEDRCGSRLQDGSDSCLSFVENMRKLKEAHERTLDMCGRLFHNVLPEGEMEEVDQGETDDLNDLVERGSDADVQELIQFDMPPGPARNDLLNKSVGSMQTILGKTSRDQVRDFTTNENIMDSPKILKGVELDPCPRVAYIDSSEADESEIERYKENRNVKIHNDTFQSAMARIEDMWDKFTVDEYAPWSSFRQTLRLKRSQSLTKMDSPSKSSQVKPLTVWKKKTTVPNPPTMLEREASKTPKKTKAMIELDRQREEKKHMEDRECKKQFKASPAPEHIRLRLFDEMNKQQDDRKRLLKENGDEILRSLQKPFEFLEREEKKKREKQKEIQQSNRNRTNGCFRARPFPAHIFDEAIEDKILEEEEYRRIRMRMRAEELLLSATAPYSMRVRDKMERRSRCMSVPREDELEISFHPKVNQKVPDLDREYQRFMKRMSKQKENRKPTAVHPFNLRQSRFYHEKLQSHSNTFFDASAGKSVTSTPVGNRKSRVSLSLDSPPTVIGEARMNEQWQSSVVDNSKDQKSTREKHSLRQKLVVSADDFSDSEESIIIRDLLNGNGRHREATSGTQKLRNARKTLAENQVWETYSDDERYRQDIHNLQDPGAHNLTYDLYDSGSDDPSETSENAPTHNHSWSHPSLIRRSEFWSNPVTNAQ